MKPGSFNNSFGNSSFDSSFSNSSYENSSYGNDSYSNNSFTNGSYGNSTFCSSSSNDNGYYNSSCYDNGTDYNETLNATTDDYYPYGDEYYPYDDAYYGDYYYLEIYQFEIVTMGYLRTILIFLTAITNMLVCGFFLKHKNRGKVTNVLFINIAISDTMTGLTLLPNSLAIYAADYTDVSKNWCLAYMIMRLYVSRVFHTVSIWQTVILSVQRYICVCHPFISGRICTYWKTIISIGVSYILAAILHVYQLTDVKLGFNMLCQWEAEQPCSKTCAYLWSCIAFQHFLPCFLLLGLTTKTLVELKRAQRRVSTMSHKSNSSSRFNRDRIITITAILIVVCFLIPELPHGIYKLVLVILLHNRDFDTLPPFENHVIVCIYEFLLIISFNVNFWIYCTMMHDFRRTIVRLVTCGMIKLRKGASRIRSFSQSSRKSILSRSSSNGSRHRVFSRTTSLHSTTSDNVHHTTIPLTSTKCTETNNDLHNNTLTTDHNHEHDMELENDVF
ncbi:hypothetical protein ACF0H5_021112 [Mactra antiquata]